MESHDPVAMELNDQSLFYVSMFQINMLLTFSVGEDCPCPADIQEELYDFHNQLQLHCGETRILHTLYIYKIHTSNTDLT